VRSLQRPTACISKEAYLLAKWLSEKVFLETRGDTVKEGRPVAGNQPAEGVQLYRVNFLT
jgi:hypothetical protein